MKILIRKATLKDLREIQKLNLLLFKKEHKEYDSSLDCTWTFGKIGTNYYTTRIKKSNGCSLIAIVDKKVVGYLVGGLSDLQPWRKIKGIAELENMFVFKEFRSFGVGSMLTREFFKWCKLKKVQIVRVTVSNQNLKAINFYKKNGFGDYDIVLEKKI